MSQPFLPSSDCVLSCVRLNYPAGLFFSPNSAFPDSSLSLLAVQSCRMFRTWLISPVWWMCAPFSTSPHSKLLALHYCVYLAFLPLPVFLTRFLQGKGCNLILRWPLRDSAWCVLAICCMWINFILLHTLLFLHETNLDHMNRWPWESWVLRWRALDSHS